MGCNKDSGCYKIYSETYPSLQSSINSSISSINGELEGIVDSLRGLSIPDDYLGAKVAERVQSACSAFSEDIGNLQAESGNISNHISQYIEVHKTHYQNWLDAQNSDDDEEETEEETSE